jgi:hypothetical protein
VRKDRLEYFERKVKACRAPKATMQTRVALIVAERGLTKKQMDKFYVQKRRDWKPRFDYQLFAKEQGVSLDWLFDGDLRAHPRGGRLNSSPRVPSGKELVEKIGGLDEAGQQFMKGYIQALVDRKGKTDEPA